MTSWSVVLHAASDAEFTELPLGVQEALAAAATLLASYGPMLGRPHADTLSGSKHANMKELRFTADDGVAGGVRVRSDTQGHSAVCRR